MAQGFLIFEENNTGRIPQTLIKTRFLNFPNSKHAGTNPH
jgi:hypothetical protein